MLDRIRAHQLALSPAERRVASLVLADPRSFTASAVGTLADRAQVSKPTVVRFCRSLGFDGLTDFKRHLAGSIHQSVPVAHRPIEAGDEIGEIVVKVLDNAVAALLKLRNDAAGRAYDQAVAALERAAQAGHRIQFHGVGASGLAAQAAQHAFFRLGLPASAASDVAVQAISASLLRRGDCAVFISRSGRSRDLVDTARLARRHGATTLAITASGTPLALLAHAPDHIVLAVDPPDGPDDDGLPASRGLHLAVVDVLATAVALRLPASTRALQGGIDAALRARRGPD